MAAPIRTLCCSVLRSHSRHFSSTCGVQAGQKWRKENAMARSGSEYGPLTDLPDWSFADGRLAPLLKNQVRRRQEREALARRIVMLDAEVDKGIETWKDGVNAAKKQEEDRRAMMYKPKGEQLRKSKAKS